MGAAGWDIPLIMHCFCFSFAASHASELSKSPSLHWRNSGSSHGIILGMIIWPFSSCISYLFLLQRNKLKYWVRLLSQITNAEVCLWMICSFHHVLLFSLFYRGASWTTGWVFLAKLKKYGFPIGWQVVTIHHAVLLLSILQRFRIHCWVSCSH